MSTDLTLPRPVSPPHVVRLELDTFSVVDRPALARWFGALFTDLLIAGRPYRLAELEAYDRILDDAVERLPRRVRVVVERSPRSISS